MSSQVCCPGCWTWSESTTGVPTGFAGPTYQSLTKAPGTDWVAVCRWITIGYGLLVVLGVIFVGLLVRHIDVPLTDPNTGITTVQTFDIGAAFAIAAIIAGAFFALFAWLTRYGGALVMSLLPRAQPAYG